MPAAFMLPHRAANQHVAYVLVAVQIRIAHVGRPQNQRVVQQRAVAVGVAFNLSRK